MTLWTFLTIFLTAAVIAEVLKARYKAKARSGADLEPKLLEMQKKYDVEMEALRKRIRNLETIAASDPDDFERKAQSFSMEDDFNETDSEDVNERLVNQLARKRTR
ncbi:MAG: hypothetical protein JJU41_07590 [Bacteroidetes bacterium]|nr:hypothetical protein [Bacteroidota bacterium]MCH8523173.1 hypothetical protein [Balneolales bacterium]